MRKFATMLVYAGLSGFLVLEALLVYAGLSGFLVPEAHTHTQ